MKDTLHYVRMNKHIRMHSIRLVNNNNNIFSSTHDAIFYGILLHKRAASRTLCNFEMLSRFRDQFKKIHIIT